MVPDATGGDIYPVDDVFFPRASDWAAGPPDVAILHTTVASKVGFLPAMGPTAMPTPASVDDPTAHKGNTVTIVGYSDNAGHDGGPTGARRRSGSMTVAGSHPANGRLFRLTGTSQHACHGDSGGPVLFGTSIKDQRVGGVISEGTGPCGDVTQETRPAYIPRAFLDRLCPVSGAPWETCITTPQLDSDFDGVNDADDNCPHVANAGQRNCNHDYDDPSRSAGDIFFHGALRGDACDPVACADIPARRLTEGPSESRPSAYTGFPFWVTTHWKTARAPFRASGYRSLSGVQHGFTATKTDPIKVQYCTCHDWKTSTPDSPKPYAAPKCRSEICRHDGTDSGSNIHRDTGWQVLLWSVTDWQAGAWVTTACGRVDADGDGNTNECRASDERTPPRTFRRLHQGAAPLCVEASLPGCSRARDDHDRFWQAPGRTRVVDWPWKDQDYPHDPDAIPTYDTSRTTSAYVRVWLRPKEIDGWGSAQQYNNTYTEPQTIKESTSLEIGRPDVDAPLFRWIVPVYRDPRAAALVVAPIPRSAPASGLPAGFSWLDASAVAATRGVAVSPLTPDGASLGSALPSSFSGPAGSEPVTAGFAVAQIDDALFALGGENGAGLLSGSAWSAIPSGAGSYVWEPLTTTSTFAASSPAAGGSPFQRWRASATSRRAATLTRHAALWTAIHRRGRATMVKPAAPRWGRSRLAGRSAASGATASITASGPPAQRFGLLVPNHAALLLVNLFGDTGAAPAAGGTTRVAVFDIAGQTWMSADLPLASGPRRHVAATVSDDGLNLLYYGGEQQAGVTGGLFLKDISDVQAVFEVDALRLDGPGQPSPGPRAHAVLRLDPVREIVWLWGGVDEAGTARTDLWRFDLKALTWTRASTGTEGDAPPPMMAAGLVISPVDGSILVVAGTRPGSVNERIWRWTGEAWRGATRYVPGP